MSGRYGNNRGHVWLKSSYDKREIDIFGFSAGYHNGPRCVKCGYEFCHHCQSGPLTDCPKAKKKKKTRGSASRKASDA